MNVPAILITIKIQLQVTTLWCLLLAINWHPGDANNVSALPPTAVCISTCNHAATTGVENSLKNPKIRANSWALNGSEPAVSADFFILEKLERAMRFELTTPTLARTDTCDL
jgi:hypothetical protein